MDQDVKELEYQKSKDVSEASKVSLESSKYKNVNALIPSAADGDNIASHIILSLTNILSNVTFIKTKRHTFNAEPRG
ncbi:MAG: hypothetical protein EZS28_008440 [Streblomastix strix]|uniref:Uncharacterized protein n=1 Tax=Streblomastix strix TaxID=222440 RepID=A0A5J4WMM3_9EUKA|nr:MAG: hypothetical protein EZS28_008440 [Streblomastix strix]